MAKTSHDRRLRKAVIELEKASKGYAACLSLGWPIGAARELGYIQAMGKLVSGYAQLAAWELNEKYKTDGA